MKQFLILITFLFLVPTPAFGLNPTMFLHQNFWLAKKIMSLFQQNNFQANIATTGNQHFKSEDSQNEECKDLETCQKDIQILRENLLELSKKMGDVNKIVGCLSISVIAICAALLLPAVYEIVTSSSK